MLRPPATAALVATSVVAGALSLSAASAAELATSADQATVTVSSVLVASTTTAPACTVDRVLRDQRITESSGLARSTRFAGVVLTHNDKGDGARYFAVGTDGYTESVVTLRGVIATDWEDVAVGPNNMVWLADIGDNDQNRGDISVYRVREPLELTDQTVGSTRFRFDYPDGAHDAEALLVHPSTARLYVVSKERDGTAAIYRAPGDLSSTQINPLTRIRGGIPDRITAGDFAPGGNNVVLRDYTQAYVYPTLADQPKVLPLPYAPQGESVTYTRSGNALLVGSEGSSSQVCRVTVP